MSTTTDAKSGSIDAQRANKSSRVRMGEWLAALTVLLAIVGMALTSPPLVGPDEAAHQATGNYVAVHIFPPVSETEDYTPGILKFGACTGSAATQDASCMPGRDDVLPGKVRIMNYPPVYYWAVGLGQKFAPGADTWMDVGGRAASLLLNIAGLGLLAWMARRVSSSWGTSLLLVTTPMAAFLWAVVNPNGWEITSGLVFAFLFAMAWWGRPGMFSKAHQAWRMWLPLGLASILFALSRHDAIVWQVLLILAVLVMAKPAIPRQAQMKAVVAAGVGLVAGLAWQMTHPAQHVDHNPDRVLNPTMWDQARWLNEIDQVIPDRIQQMVGSLGSLDTPTPQWMVLMLVLGWGALIGFLCARTRIPVPVLAVGFLGIVLVPSLLEMLRWNDWPYWWQGRITLSFAIPFLFVFLIRFVEHGRRPAVWLSLVMSGVLAYMVWQNFARYAFGIDDYLPQRWTDPATGDLVMWGTGAIVLAIIVIVVMRTAMLMGERRVSDVSRH